MHNRVMGLADINFFIVSIFIKVNGNCFPTNNITNNAQPVKYRQYYVCALGKNVMTEVEFSVYTEINSVYRLITDMSTPAWTEDVFLSV